jgi:uncharacterized membrane protein YkgB
LVAVVVLGLLLLAPLTWHTLNSNLWSPFDTLRVGLLVIDILMLGTGAAVLAEVVLLTKRRKSLQ